MEGGKKCFFYISLQISKGIKNRFLKDSLLQNNKIVNFGFQRNRSGGGGTKRVFFSFPPYLNERKIFKRILHQNIAYINTYKRIFEISKFWLPMGNKIFFFSWKKRVFYISLHISIKKKKKSYSEDFRILQT